MSSERLREIRERLDAWSEDPDVRGGRPCVPGHRFPVEMLLSQLTTEDSLKDISENFELPLDSLQRIMCAIIGMFASAPSDIRWLLDAVFSLQDEVNSLEEELSDVLRGRHND